MIIYHKIVPKRSIPQLLISISSITLKVLDFTTQGNIIPSKARKINRLDKANKVQTKSHCINTLLCQAETWHITALSLITGALPSSSSLYYSQTAILIILYLSKIPKYTQDQNHRDYALKDSSLNVSMEEYHLADIIFLGNLIELRRTTLKMISNLSEKEKKRNPKNRRPQRVKITLLFQNKKADYRRKKLL